MTGSGLSRRHLLTRGGLLLGAAVAAPSLLTSCSQAANSAVAGAGKTTVAGGGKTAVSMQLGWLLDNGQLGEAVAIGKGWYADNGLSVNITPGGPSIDGLTMVAGGRSQIGQISSSPSLMLASSQGIPTRAFAVGVQEHPYGFFSKSDKPVREPKDLIGKTVGTQATGQILLSALLAANKIDPADVKVVVVGSDVTPLTTGRVDVWTGWVSNVAALRPLGTDYQVMRLWDAGIQLYANPYYTTDQMLKNDKETLTKFLAASAEGWKYAKENLKESVDFLVKLAPSLNKDDMMAQGQVLLKYEFTDATVKDGWGTMNKDVWQRQLDMWKSLGQFKGKVPSLADVANFDILDATAGQRPKV